MTAASHDAEGYLTQVFTEYVDSGVSLGRFITTRPRVAVSAIRAIRRLPVLTVRLPSTREADAVAEALLAHPASRRAMLGVSAVLRTPEVPGGYADGHDRATVRRKMRASVKQGIEIRPVAAEDRPRLLALADRHEQQNDRAEYRIDVPDNDDLLQYDLWLAAYDADGAPIVLSVIPCAGQWAVLRYLRTLTPGRASSDARYLITDAVAEALAARGVRYLVDTSRPHWLPNGLRHFQRMVGFRLVRLRLVRERRG